MATQINATTQNLIIKKNALLSLVLKIVEYSLSFFSAPLLLHCLGEYKYGIYATLLSFVSWIYYFDFGIGGGLRNRVTEFLVQNDYDSITKCINVAYICMGCISLTFFIIILLLSFSFNFENMLNMHLKEENVDVIIVVSFLFVCLNLIFSLVINLLYSLQKTALVYAFGIISKLIMLLALIVYYLFQIKLMLFFVVLEGGVQFVKNLIGFIYLYKYNSKLLPSFNNFDISYVKSIVGFGLQIFCMQICALVLNATDNILISKYFGAQDVTPYSLCQKYFSIIEALFVALISPLWTTYTRAYVLKDKKYIVSTLSNALILYAFTFVLIIISLYFFKSFMRFYLRIDLNYPNGLPFLFAVYFALLMFSHIFSSFVHGISKLKLTTIACIVGALLNIPLSIYSSVSLKLGINGIIIGSIVSLLISTTAYVYTSIKEIKKLGA